jgi:glutamate 5-kinase
MAIASGRVERPIKALRQGGRATWFLSTATPAAARKQWIAGSLRPKGRIHVDEGAARALGEGRSLLPAGVTAVEGDFERGDAVSVVNGQGIELARGLVAYSRAEAALIAGKRSDQTPEILGYRGRNEMIHRDDLVVTQRNPDS